MSVRRWQVPVQVATAAAVAMPRDRAEAERNRDLAARVPVGVDTLFAIVSSAQDSQATPMSVWAESVYRQSMIAEDARVAETLVAAGFDQTGCTPDAFGILDPAYLAGERVCAVIRASGDTFERWGPDGWADCHSPDGMPYVELRGDALSDALEASSANMSLLLRPTQPRAFLASRDPGILVATSKVVQPAQPVPPSAPVAPAPQSYSSGTATPPDTSQGGGTPSAPVPPPPTPNAASSPADAASGSGGTGSNESSGVYAITDPFDTTAVITLFEAKPGPEISVRVNGVWKPDDGTLLGQLKSIDPPPVVSVPLDQVPAVTRQVDDFDQTHPQAAKHPTGGMVSKPAVAASASPDDGPKVAGLAVRAKDTGRVFMLQRSIADPKDPAAGTWEFPGGHADPGEPTHQAAQREWQEETGHDLPSGPLDPDAPSWTSPNGVYQGFVHDIPDESAIDLRNRDSYINPDDPDGDQVEAVAWWDPTKLSGNPVVRPELAHTMHLVHTALDPTSLAAAAQTDHATRIQQAKDADSQFDAERASADHAEQMRRHAFEAQIGHRHGALVGEGVDPHDAATAVAREISAEDDRRELWEKDRVEALAAEKARRLHMHPVLRQSAALVVAESAAQEQAEQESADAGTDEDEPVGAVTADAVAHTAMPHQLEEYWTKGTGAAKVRWGTPGDFNRCREELAKYLHPEQISGACNELHKLATGIWPATHAKMDRALTGGKK